MAIGSVVPKIALGTHGILALSVVSSGSHVALSHYMPNFLFKYGLKCLDKTVKDGCEIRWIDSTNVLNYTGYIAVCCK